MKQDNIKFLPVDFDPFAVESNDSFHTTEAQKEIWTNVQFGGHDANCAYNESVSLDLHGQFNSDVFFKAIELLYARHQALNAVFSDDGNWMIINPDLNPDTHFVDISDQNENTQNSIIHEAVIAEAEKEFDLACGPLSRVKLFKRSTTEYKLILTLHHIICDGWSLGILLQDLGKIYSSIVDNKNYDLEPALAYKQYSINEEEFNKSEEFKKVKAYWLDQFKERNFDMNLPGNKVRPALRTYNAERIDIAVESGLIAALRKIGGQNGTSFITTITAAFEIFLSKITGNDSIVVGLAAAGQSATGMERLVGHCVNLLLLKSKIDDKLTFVEYLKIRKPQILDAYDNQRFTFGNLIKLLNIPRNPGQIPLVPVSFNVDMGLTDGVSFSGCTFDFSTNPRHYENFEIFINAAGNGDNLMLECTYNSTLFTSDMMHLRIHEFVQLIKSIVENEYSRIGRLNFLTDEEVGNIFFNWQGKRIELNSEICVHDLVDQFAMHKPEETALQYGNTKVTYGELKKKSDQLASYLNSKGVQPGDTVILYMNRSVEVVFSLLAILKAGAAYVPVDISYPDERVRYIIEDSQSRFIITHTTFASQLSYFSGLVVYAESFNEIFDNTQDIILSGVENPNALAYIIYTSGSTGKPKGVAIEHFSLLNYISWCNQYYFDDNIGGNFSLYSSLSFDLTVTSIYCSLTRGNTLVIFPQHLDVADILKETFAEDSIVDTIKMTPAHILLLDAISINTGSIKKAIVGGEELTTQHVQILRKINPGIRIFNEYGPTEATVGCIVKEVIYEEDCHYIGTPIHNMSAFVLDRNQMPLPPGITGHLFLGGYGLANSYFNRETLTNEKFKILTLNNEHERLYDSGDLARFNLNGELVFLGRIDDQVKIRGFRIELGEIEAVLIRSGVVRKSVVTVHEFIPGDKQLIAYLELNDGEQKDTSFFFSYLSSQIPDYMIPAAFIFVDNIPLTVNGKIDRKALPSPERSEIQNTSKFEEPATATEQILANLWCDLLLLNNISRNDNFFELGGHSLLGVKLFSDIDKLLGVKLNLSVLFTAPTIKELAGIIANNGVSKPVPSLVPLQSKGSKHPLFCIHMHNGNVNRWRVLVKHFESDQPIYALQPLGLNINVTPHSSIEEMASYYIDVIRSVQPSGPYNLIGLCFSGMVVYEMAIRLEAMGEKVAFLGMINNYAPPENPTLYRIKTGLNKFMKMELGDKFNYAIEKNLNLGKKLIFKESSITPTHSEVTGNTANSTAGIDIGNDLRTIHSVALLNYHPTQQYNGDLWIYRTSDPIEKYFNEHLGWDRLVKGKIETTIINDCDNDTIITDEPYNVELSLKIKQHLEQL